MRLFAFCFLLAWPVAAAEMQFAFSGLASNSPLAKFHAEVLGGGGPADWRVIEIAAPSAFAPLTDRAPSVSRQGVLAQLSQNPDDERFPLFVYDGEKFRDFTFKVKFKIVSGIAEQMAGVVFRFQNTSNFYVARVSALGRNIRFYKVVNGQRSDPVGVPCKIEAGAWHELAVHCEGTHITLGLDGRPVMPTLEDITFTEGRLGFWTKSDSVTYFADADINYTPIIPAAQMLVSSVMEQQPRILGLDIYTLATNGAVSVLASKDPENVGKPGTDAEAGAIRNGTPYFGRDHGAVLVTMPLHDRNGDTIAAVRFKLRSFFGETQDNAVGRAMLLMKTMQELCTSADD
jgi:hypothetical protein